MHFAALITLVVTASPQVKVAVPDLSVVNVDANRASFYSEQLAQGLTKAGLSVTTSKQIQSVISLERQKELLGCSDSSESCMAELANALGADGLVSGTVALVGKTYQLNVSIVDARDGKQLALYSEKVETEEALLEGLRTGGQKLGRTTLRKLRPDQAPPTLRSRAWIPAVAAVPLGVLGGVFIARGNSVGAQLAGETSFPGGESSLSTQDAESLRDSGKTMQTVGAVGLGLAGASLAAAVSMFVFGGEDETLALLPLREGGAFVSLGGAF